MIPEPKLEVEILCESYPKVIDLRMFRVFCGLKAGHAQNPAILNH